MLAKTGPMEAALLGATMAKEELHLAGYLHLKLKEAALLGATIAMGASGSTRIASAPASRLAALLPPWPAPAASAATSLS